MKIFINEPAEASTPVAGDFVIIRRITSNLTIVTGTTRLQRFPIIADGVEITIEETGELYIL